MLGQLGGLASLAGINVSSVDAQTEEALAVLRSRAFTERFIVDKNLMPEMFPRDWDKTRNNWKTSPDERPTLARAYRYFHKKIRSVVQDKKTGLVTLRIDWRDRVAAAEWANELVMRLNAEMRSRAIRQADASIKFLQDELTKTSEVEVRDSISRLIEAQIEQRMLANVMQEYAFRIADTALPEDPRDPIWPQRSLLIVGGAILGLLAGIFVVLLYQMLRPVNQS